MKGYTPYFISIILVLIFTFVQSCSENKNEEKLLNEVEEVYDQAYDNHQTFALAQDTLQASIDEWKEEHEVFTDDYQPSDELEKEHVNLYEDYIKLVKKHDSLLTQHNQFLNRIEQLKEKIDDETAEASNELKKVYVQIDEYVNAHKDFMEQYQIMEEKHNDYLYGQRIDEH